MQPVWTELLPGPAAVDKKVTAMQLQNQHVQQN